MSTNSRKPRSLSSDVMIEEKLDAEKKRRMLPQMLKLKLFRYLRAKEWLFGLFSLVFCMCSGRY